MTTYASLDDLSGPVRDAVINLLYRMADDELVIGHRNSEWTGLAPILEEDVAFSSLAQDEMGHARVYYEMLHELGEPVPDTLAFSRQPQAFCCASLVSLPNDHDWALCITRQYLYDAAETVRLTNLADGSLTPLARLARKLRSEEKYHLMHGRSWMLRLGNATEDSRKRMQAVLDRLYPHALGLFEPTEADEVLSGAGVCPGEEELRVQWESAIAPVFSESGLVVPTGAEPIYGGRTGRQPDALVRLLADMQLVHNIDPSAKW